MTAGKLDLPPIWRGCDWGPITLKWKDANGAPIPLNSWRPIAQSLNIDLNPVVLPQNIHDNVGVTTLSLTRDQTATLRLGTESWDWIWERNTNPTVYRFPPFLSGKVEIKQSTSKFPPPVEIPEVPQEEPPPVPTDS